MASFGSAYLAWLLLIVDSFLLPVKPVGPAVPGNQIYQYLSSSSTVVLHFDIRSIKYQFDKSLQQLGNLPVVAQNPMFKQMYEQLDHTIKRGIRQMESTLKVVKLDQIRFITVGLEFKQNIGKPEIMIVVHGELEQKMIDGFVEMRKAKVTRSEAYGMSFYFNENSSQPSMAWTPTGQILLGTPDAIRHLSTNGIEKLQAGSLRHQLVQQYSPTHVVAVGMQQNETVRRQAGALPAMIQPLVEDLTGLYAAAWGGGSHVTLWSKTPTTTKRYAVILKGLGQISVASDYFRRGLINVADGMIAPSNQPLNHPVLDSLVQNKDVIFAYIRQFFSRTLLNYQVQTTPNSAQLTFTGNGGITIPVMGVFGVIGIAQPRKRRYRSRHTRPAPQVAPAQPPATAPKPMP